MADDDARLERKIETVEAKIGALRAAFDGLMHALADEAPAVRTKIIDHLRAHQSLAFERKSDLFGAELGRLLATHE